MPKIVALAGGVGGSKMADGLAQVLPEGDLTVIVNVGDDFRHYGLHISPDLDTMMYTLSGYANTETGWGIKDETWRVLGMWETYGEPPWFRLGDQDLATHILRTHALAQGQTLTAIMRRLSTALGVKQVILPVTNDPFATMLETEGGTLPFQEYFVRQRWQPKVKKIWYDGEKTARLTEEVEHALNQAEALIICPSNPLLSIDPILAVGDLRHRLANRHIPCLAVSPLIGGQAIKGPADKLMSELGVTPSSDGLWQFYQGLIDVLVVNAGDEPTQGTYVVKPILMKTRADRRQLAEELLVYLGVL